MDIASPLAAAAFERAYVLSRRAPDSETLLPILTGLFNYRIMTNDTVAAKRLAARIHRLARGKCAPAYALDGYNTVGYMNWKLGRYAAALPCIKRVASAYRIRRHGALSIVFGEDPAISCHYYAAVTCVMLGDLAPRSGTWQQERRSPTPSSSPLPSPKCCGRIA